MQQRVIGITLCCIQFSVKLEGAVYSGWMPVCYFFKVFYKNALDGHSASAFCSIVLFLNAKNASCVNGLTLLSTRLRYGRFRMPCGNMPICYFFNPRLVDFCARTHALHSNVCGTMCMKVYVCMLFSLMAAVVRDDSNAWLLWIGLKTVRRMHSPGATLLADRNQVWHPEECKQSTRKSLLLTSNWGYEPELRGQFQLYAGEIIC